MIQYSFKNNKELNIFMYAKSECLFRLIEGILVLRAGFMQEPMFALIELQRFPAFLLNNGFQLACIATVFHNSILHMCHQYYY